MAQFEITFKPMATYHYVVEADSEDEAVQKAWDEFKESSQVQEPEWDVDDVINMDEE